MDPSTMFQISGDLYSGCILASIIHALMLTRYPDLSHEQSWDGMNYNVQNSMGARGTVTFSKDDLVAAFYDVNSPRAQASTDDPISNSELLEGIPERLRPLIEEETLQYLLEDVNGTVKPLFTAIFWANGDRLQAIVPWSDVMANGGHLIKTQLLPLERALVHWQNIYEMTPMEVKLCKDLFDRKIAAGHKSVALTPGEMEMIMDLAVDQESVELVTESLEEIGINTDRS